MERLAKTSHESGEEGREGVMKVCTASRGGTETFISEQNNTSSEGNNGNQNAQLRYPKTNDDAAGREVTQGEGRKQPAKGRGTLCSVRKRTQKLKEGTN